MGLLFGGLAGYSLNDLKNWISNDDGSPLPNPVIRKNPYLTAAGVVLVGGLSIFVYKKLIK